MKFILLSLVFGMLTFLLTTIGAFTVYSIRQTNKRLIALFLGFGGGVMVAASFFSLILPAINFCDSLNYQGWLICLSGFIIGITIILIVEKCLYPNNDTHNQNNIKLMVLAVIIHNIPEGLAIGVAFGSVALGVDNTSILAPIMLSIGIGLQNLPEGAAISIPLHSIGISKKKSFIIGASSAIVEPICAVIGVVLVTLIKSILPIVLSIAAAIMIFVVIDEIISLGHEYHKRLTSIGFIVGFVIMMILDLMFN